MSDFVSFSSRSEFLSLPLRRGELTRVSITTCVIILASSSRNPVATMASLYSSSHFDRSDLVFRAMESASAGWPSSRSNSSSGIQTSAYTPRGARQDRHAQRYLPARLIAESSSRTAAPPENATLRRDARHGCDDASAFGSTRSDSVTPFDSISQVSTNYTAARAARRGSSRSLSSRRNSRSSSSMASADGDMVRYQGPRQKETIFESSLENPFCCHHGDHRWKEDEQPFGDGRQGYRTRVVRPAWVR